MKKSKAISLLLCLSLLASLLIPGTLAMPAKAAEGDTDNGMKVNKTAVAKDDGTYTITLEAYATGEKIISEVKKDVPTDIVLVLDQSGSMEKDIGTVSFEAYNAKTKNSAYYSYRHNGGSGKLYYRLADGSYASVSVTTKETVDYEKITSGRNNSSWNRATNYWENQENLIAYVSGKPVAVTVSREGEWYNRVYTYMLADGTVIATSSLDTGTPTFKGVNENCLYLKSVDTAKTVYTYSYTDASGNEHTIETSTGANGTIKTTLYQRIVSTNGGGSRLNALKSAVTTFANNVAKKAKGSDGLYGTDDDVNHRIAVVSFADYASNLTNGFIDMDKANGLTSVTSAVNGLRADGNTYPAAGIKEANNIFSKNSIESGKRNRVIVLFTDGYPAPRGTDDIDYVLCDNAISSAYTSKHNYGATVYTVAIFSGANPNSDIDSNYERDSINATKQLVAANRYMHYTSSNYPDARSMENGGSKAKDGYYLSAADADTLNNIFQKISDQIESGGSSTTLGRETVIKDIVAPAFDMPKNPSDIKVYTAASNGSTTNWNNRVEFKEGAVTPDTENSTISVSGFSFKDNWCGTETKNGEATFHDGKKLIIEFTVTPKADFLGGNNVYTNTSAGVYENSSATSPVMEFDRPQVNVPINNVTVTAENKNVYLLSDLTADEIKTGATVKCGEVSLNLGKASENYGLEKWQTEYVDITVEIKDARGSAVTNLSDLKDDTTYTITATVKPKAGLDGKDAAGTPNSTDGKSGTKDAGIFVFKPELTYKDSEVYYGDTAPTDFSENKTSEVWKHDETPSTAVTMIGDKPTLDITCIPESGKITNGKVNTTQDIAVDATVEIDGTDVTGYTTFQHTNCTDKQCGTPAKGKFWLHVKTCQLTITKTGCEDIDENQSFIFDVTGPNGYSQRVVIKENDSVTIKDLPIDTYTITEVSSWSWRYSANGQTVTLQPGVTNEVTVQNKRNLIYWLNGCGYAQNIFG